MITTAEYQETVRNMRHRTTRLDREGDCWTDNEKHRLRIMFNQGVGITEMAVRLQRSEPAVYQQIEKSDLYRRKEHPKRKQKQKHHYCLCNRCKCAGYTCFRYAECQSNREGM